MPRNPAEGDLTADLKLPMPQSAIETSQLVHERFRLGERVRELESENASLRQLLDEQEKNAEAVKAALSKKAEVDRAKLPRRALVNCMVGDGRTVAPGEPLTAEECKALTQGVQYDFLA